MHNEAESRKHDGKNADLIAPLFSVHECFLTNAAGIYRHGSPPLECARFLSLHTWEWLRAHDIVRTKRDSCVRELHAREGNSIYLPPLGRQGNVQADDLSLRTSYNLQIMPASCSSSTSIVQNRSGEWLLFSVRRAGQSAVLRSLVT